jgi:hypothetical protein
MAKNENKEFRGINHGKGQIDLQHLGVNQVQLRPTEIHLKENGDLDDNPSVAIVLSEPSIKFAVVGQLSLKMWNEGLADIGYEIRKKEPKCDHKPKKWVEQIAETYCPECWEIL